MKKILVTSSFLFVFAVYTVSQYFGVNNTVAYVAPNTQPLNVTVPATQPVIPPKQTIPTTVPVTTKPLPVPTPVPVTKKGLYTDGSYTGSVANAYYGNIQVQATVSGGQLTDVQFLQYPNDRSTSIRKNTMAMPILKSEAIASQSANVRIVSGATDSSQAFQQSLGDALTQARNA